MWIGVAFAGLVVLGPILLSPDRTLPFHYGYVLVFAAGVLGLVSRMRTVGEGDRLEIERRWGGRLTIALRRVRSVRVSTYYPRIDGGWGVRNGEGVILTLDDGEVLYVGSARAEALCDAIRARQAPVAAEGRARAPERVRIPG